MKKMLIQDFCLIYEENSINLLYRKDGLWETHDFLDEYDQLLINTISDNFDGIIINIKNKSYEVQTSLIGSINVFSLVKDRFTFVGTNLDYMIEKSNFNLTYNERKLNDYFALSYHALDDLSIYNDIKILQKNTKIIITSEVNYILDNKEHIYSDMNNNVHFDDVLDSLTEFSKSTIQNTRSKDNLLLLSGGKDSLIGGLLIRLLTKDINTSTQGVNVHTNDIISGQKRSDRLFPKSIHHNYFLENIKYDKLDYVNYAKILGGFGPFSSIAYFKYFQHLEKLGFKNYYFSCHFECTRKKIVSDDYFELNNTTPKEVVGKYFNKKSFYYDNLESIKNKMKNKYSVDPYYQFYFNDRNIQGGYYKSLLSREFGQRKITLSSNAKFLNLNYNYIKQNNTFTYDKILDNLLKMNDIKKNDVVYDNLVKANLKDIPINPQNDLISIKSFYIYLIDKNSNSVFSEMFNLNKIKHSLITEDFGIHDHWFLLRLFQVLNYKNINDERISM